MAQGEKGMTDPVGVAEIAGRAGVKPDTVQKWRIRHNSFPPPAVMLSMGPVWDWPAVAEWLADPRSCRS